MFQRKRLMLSCAVGVMLLGAGAAAAQSANQPRSAATTADQSAQSSGETSGQAARAGATSQNTQAASAAAVGQVVVTGTSRHLALQHLPVAATVFTDERRNLVGIETESDIVNFTPSMSLNGQFLSIRGVGRYTDELGTDPGVAVFVDGIYTPSPDYLNQPDFFTDRIEVLRGPQGTLGGDNDIGGSVNVVEKRPTDQFHEEARLGVTSYAYMYTDLSVSGPITHDLTFRLAEAYADQPHNRGFVKNLDSPVYPGSGSLNLVEAQLEWKPAANFDAWFKVQDFQQDTAATYGVNPDQYPEYPPNSAFGGNCPTVNTVAFSCLAPAPADLLPPASNPQIGRRGPSNSVVNDNTVGYVKLKDDWTFTTQLTWTLPGATLEYIGGYSQYDYQYLSDFDGTPSNTFGGVLPANFIAQTVTGVQWEKWYQNELQLKSANDSKLRWIVGAFQYWNNYTAPYNQEEPNNFALTHPTGGPVNPFRDFYGQVADFTDKSEAVYGNVDYDVTDTLRLTGGLRYNWDEKDGHVHFFEVFDTAGIFFAPALGSLYTANVTENAHISSSDWTGKIGAEWRPDPSTLVYASVTKGYKSGGLALADFVPIPSVAPETLYDYEGGFKKTFGGQLLIDADVYYYDYRNLQQFLSALNTTTGLVSSTLVSAQRARTYGFELESVWSPTQDFQLTFNYSYLNARFTQFRGPIVDFSQLAPGCIGTGTVLSGPGSCSGVTHANLNGDVVPQSPENKVTINPVYTMHLPIGQVTLSATYAFVDKQYYSVFTNPNFLAPSYYNLDLRLLYQPPQGHYTFIFYARNVTNQLQIVNYSTGYFVYGPANLVKAPAAYPSRGQVTYFNNAPQVFGVELQVRF